MIECCLSGVLGRMMMREGLRDPERLGMVSKRPTRASGQLDTIIRVDKIIFEGILIVVLVWIRRSYSARHHGGHDV
jgi:hypothetical protein